MDQKLMDDLGILEHNDFGLIKMPIFSARKSLWGRFIDWIRRASCGERGDTFLWVYQDRIVLGECESCGAILETWIETDQKLAILSGNPEEFREKEVVFHVKKVLDEEIDEEACPSGGFHKFTSKRRA